MSVDPQTMRMLLAQSLMQSGQGSGNQGTAAGGMGGMQPQVTPNVGTQNAVGNAANLAQRIMLMRALQQRGQGQPGNPGGANLGPTGQPQTGPMPLPQAPAPTPAAVPASALWNSPAAGAGGGMPPS